MSMQVTLITLGDPKTVTGGYLYHSRMEEAAHRHNFAFEFASVPVGPLASSVTTAHRLLRAAERERDVVVCDSIVATFLRASAPQRRRAAVVAMIHQPPGGMEPGTLGRLARQRLDRAAYRRMDRLIVASEQLRQQFIREGFGVHSLVVIAPGRDAPTEGGIETPVEDLRQGRQAALLCVGNWVRRKQIIELLEAFSRLPKGLATLHLVGSDAVDPSYAEAVRDRLVPLSSSVVVHGAQSRARVQAMYEQADIFVLASIQEPYGTVYGEALAAGLPVIGWRAGNLPYLVTDGLEGLLSEPGDVSALADAISRLTTDRELRKMMGAAARRRGQELPTWEATAAAFFEELRKTSMDHSGQG
jgi:glycosyltransferase involved in cell wall biosynthesis